MSMLTCSACDGLTPAAASATCLHCDAPLRRPPRWVLRMTKLLGPAGAILLAACYGAPGRYRAERPAGPGGAEDRQHDARTDRTRHGAATDPVLRAARAHDTRADGN
ncbi:MAG: hypothetical protein ABI175_18265, partial [Polyangiales bacterium]